jgi:hypothetical protein
MLGQSFGSVRPVRGSSEFPPFVLTRPTQLRSDWTRAIVRRWSRRLTNKNSHTFERSISTPCASFNVKKMYRDFVRFSGESDHRPSRVPSPIDGPRPDTHPATAILPRPDTNQPHPPPLAPPRPASSPPAKTKAISQLKRFRGCSGPAGASGNAPRGGLREALPAPPASVCLVEMRLGPIRAARESHPGDSPVLADRRGGIPLAGVPVGGRWIGIFIQGAHRAREHGGANRPLGSRRVSVTANRSRERARG